MAAEEAGGSKPHFPNMSNAGKPKLAWRLEGGQSTDETGEPGHEVCSAKEYDFHPACSQGGAVD